MMQLRPQQEIAVREIGDCLKKDLRRIAYVAPTGSGKGSIMAFLAANSYKQGKKMICVFPISSLVSQMKQRFIDWGVPENEINILSGNQTTKTQDGLITIAMAQTLTARQSKIDFKQWDVAILDECHLTTFHKSIRAVFSEVKTVVGLTATPWVLGRKKQEKFADLYQATVVGGTYKEQVIAGYLVPLRWQGIATVDMKGAKVTNGDYHQEDLIAKCNVEEQRQALVASYKEHCHLYPAVAFCVDVQHAYDLRDDFNSFGYKAVTITGETPESERLEYFKQLSNGDINVITSVDTMTTGVDIPAIRCVMLARPTKSKALFQQQVGRGSRLHPDKEFCMILDQAGNLKRHGFPESLCRADYKITPPKENEGNPPPMKICEKCGQYCYGFVLRCPHCGHEFPIKQKVLRASPKLEAQYPKEAKELRQWVRLAFNSKYKPSYPIMRFREQYNEDPIKDWYRGALYHSPDHESLHHYCHHLLNLLDQGKIERKLLGMYLKLEFDESFIRAHSVAIPDEFYA